MSQTRIALSNTGCCQENYGGACAARACGGREWLKYRLSRNKGLAPEFLRSQPLVTAQRGELLQFGNLMCKKSDGHGRQGGFSSISGIER